MTKKAWLVASYLITIALSLTACAPAVVQEEKPEITSPTVQEQDEVLEYARSLNIPDAIIQELAPIGPEMDDYDKAFIELLVNYRAFHDESIIKQIVADGKVSTVEIEALKHLAKLPEEIQLEYIDFGLNTDVLRFLVVTSTLVDQAFAEYAIRNRLTIQDRRLTDLELHFLKEPERYSGELFGRYMLDLFNVYPELAEELGKLPNFKQVSIKNIKALERILRLARDNRNKEFLEAILNEGIRDKRKYCAPLEALLWIAYDEERFITISISALVSHAWRFSSTSQDYTSDRWQNFDEVVDRLSSPSLVALYMTQQLTYDIWRSVGMGYPVSASLTFNTKKGTCDHMANFAAYLLEKNGYEAHYLRAGQVNPKPKIIQGRSIGSRGHSVALYKESSVFYYIDGPTPNRGASIHGPFATIEDAAKKFCTDLDYRFEWYRLFSPNEPTPEHLR